MLSKLAPSGIPEQMVLKSKEKKYERNSFTQSVSEISWRFIKIGREKKWKVVHFHVIKAAVNLEV